MSKVNFRRSDVILSDVRLAPYDLLVATYNSAKKLTAYFLVLILLTVLHRFAH